MKLSIHQPLFLPYIGAWNLIANADQFVVYDNLKFCKGAFTHRNRMLLNGHDEWFTLPLRKGSDYLHIRDRELTDFDRKKLLAKFEGAYRTAPYFKETMALLEEVMATDERNLFSFLRRSIDILCAYLRITTRIINSSSVPIDHSLKSQNKVLAICHALGADKYVNASGGVGLYSREVFASEGVQLGFIRALPFEYQQIGGGKFVPWLSIIDLLAHLPLEQVIGLVHDHYEEF